MIGIFVKSRKRPVANLALGGKPGGQQRVAERHQRGAAPPVPRPSLTSSSRRLLWRGRSALVTAAQKAILCEDRVAFVPASIRWSAPERVADGAIGNDASLLSGSFRGAAVAEDPDAAPHSELG